MRFSTTITLDGIDCITSVPRGSRAWRLATSVFCPLGPAPTKAWILMRGAEARALSSAAHSLEWTTKGAEGFAEQSLTFGGLYVVNAERLLHGGPADDDALYLVELGDARWKLSQGTRETGAIRANIRSYANNSDYLTGTSGYTWTSLLTELWNACGLLGAFPGLPGGLPIDAQPENTFLIGLDAWRSLCAVLEQLDCAVKHDPLTNTYTIVQLGSEQTVPPNVSTEIWNGEPVDVSGSTAAATLRIYFHYHRKSYGQERDTELATNWAYNGAGDIKDIATGISGAAGTKALWDDLPWILDEDNAAANDAALNTRRDNRKARYVTRQSVVAAHRIHAGLLSDILPGGQVRAVIWRNWDDPENDFGGTVTEFVSKTELVTGCRQTEVGPAWFDSDLGAPERENYLAPDLGRHSYPNYPRLPNIVQVVNTSYSGGELVQPNADGFHAGKVRRWVANAMSTLDSCWIRFVDDHDTLDGQVDAVNLDFYGPARLSGVSTSGGTLLPVYTVRRGPLQGNPVRKFKLTAALSTGSNAAAVLRVFNGTAYVDGAAIRVYDWYGLTAHAPGGSRGMFQAFEGMEGVCILRDVQSSYSPGGLPEYNIIWMEVYAWNVECTLSASGSDWAFEADGSSLAVVTASFHQGVAPPDNITVYDSQGMFPRARDGAKCKVWRDEYADPANPGVPYYRVVQCQQVATTARAVLAEDMCGPGETAIEEFQVTSFSPFDQEPPEAAKTVALNDFGHKGMAGDNVWLAWDDDLEAYVIIDVTKKEQQVVFDIRLAGNYIQALETACAVEYCEPPEWVDKIPVGDCETQEE